MVTRPTAGPDAIREPRPAQRARVAGRSLVKQGALLFALLLGLYYLSTTIGRDEERMTTWGVVGALTSVAFLRIVGRLALPVPMYVHVFPRVHPFYGLANVGLFARALDVEFFPDTFYVFRHFAGPYLRGSSAIPALADFYGQFSFLGWVLGALCLGILLERIDALLARVRERPSGLLLVVGMLMFAYYLSQASIPRALLGYGGAVFALLWLSLNPRCFRCR